MWDLSSLTKDQTHVPCIGRWILYPWTTREVPKVIIDSYEFTAILNLVFQLILYFFFVPFFFFLFFLLWFDGFLLCYACVLFFLFFCESVVCFWFVSHSFFLNISWVFILFYFLINLFIFGCIGYSLLRAGFLQLWHVGATLRCGAHASQCGGFSCCGTWALGARASVVVAHGLSSCGLWALECRLSSCGARA